jgi:hypothetical protein
MCFAPQADLIGGVVVSGAGIDALRHVRHRREIALAALPLLFGAHQVIEAFAWWGLEGSIPASVGDMARDLYLFIAFTLPLVLPVAVRSIEPDPDRRRLMVPLTVIGGFVTATLIAELSAGPVSAVACSRYIAYDAGLAFGGLTASLYVVSVCVPLLISTFRRLRIFGVVNVVAVIGLAWLLQAGFISLWCAWAAVFSLVIVMHLRSTAVDEDADATMAQIES